MLKAVMYCDKKLTIILYTKCMDLKTMLQSGILDTNLLLKNFRKKDLIEELQDLVNKDFAELEKNEDYSKNVMELVSLIFAYEQLIKQKSEKNQDLQTSIFHKEFLDKLKKLRNHYVHSSLSK